METLYRSNSRLRGPRNRSGRYGDDINLLPLPEIKRRSLGPPPLSLGSISSALSRLICTNLHETQSHSEKLRKTAMKVAHTVYKHVRAYVYDISPHSAPLAYFKRFIIYR
jgi:hypothetical protein